MLTTIEELYLAHSKQLCEKRTDLMGKLSPAQARVCVYLVAGLTEKQAAVQIGISHHTVHDHTKAIYRLFGVENRVQLGLKFTMPEVLL